ncbi:MAG: ATPase, T2SS/T4P/T4SS family [Peptococcaceae bacterium]|nr:ATPase, T2SS/T4P/T4SS family [Peptococcaceae bacterium]
MDLLRQARAQFATDLHLGEEAQAFVRVLGKLAPLEYCSRKRFAQIYEQLLAARASKNILEKKDEGVKDFSATLPEIGRLRVHLYHSQGRAQMAIRFLPEALPSEEALAWPPAMTRLCKARQGLILVTGATGSGKSTTLAAMLEAINARRACHIVTFEQPIEYLFGPGQALIHQCEVSVDVPSFAAGAQAALREDPDVIMLGELAERDAMQAALKLAESGHLVLASMHAASSIEAVEYFLQHFAAADQPLARHQLASVLRAVISQRLLVDSDGAHWLPVYEVLLRNDAVVNQIRTGEFEKILHTLELGRAAGMVTLEAALAEKVRAGRLDIDAALATANRPHALEKLLST